MFIRSNGRGGALSRSWNRIYAQLLFEHNNLAGSLLNHGTESLKIIVMTIILTLKIFWGYGEIRTAYKLEKHTVSLMIRNVVESEFSEGAVELSWSFPLGNYDYFKGYVHYFNGYGHSLID